MVYLGCVRAPVSQWQVSWFLSHRLGAPGGRTQQTIGLNGSPILRFRSQAVWALAALKADLEAASFLAASRDRINLRKVVPGGSA